MELSNWIQLMIGIPLLGFLISLAVPERKETWLSRVAFNTAGINLLATLVFLVFWVFQGGKDLNLKEIILFKNEQFEFLIDFFFALANINTYLGFAHVLRLKRAEVYF